MKFAVAIILVSFVLTCQGFSLSKTVLVKYALQGIIKGVSEDIKNDIHNLIYGEPKEKTWTEKLAEKLGNFNKLLSKGKTQCC